MTSTDDMRLATAKIEAGVYRLAEIRRHTQTVKEAVEPQESNVKQ